MAQRGSKTKPEISLCLGIEVILGRENKTAHHFQNCLKINTNYVFKTYHFPMINFNFPIIKLAWDNIPNTALNAM